MPTAKEMVQEAKMKAEVEVQNFAAIESQLDLDLKAENDKGYDLAKVDLGIPSDAKIYTEEDLAAEKKILQDQVDSLKSDKDSFAQQKADAVAAAVDAREIEIGLAIEATEVDNMELAKKLQKKA